jgi:DNA-binding IclR family transcriptional regulator
MRLVAENGKGIRLCELSRECQLPRNTVYNLADTLVREGLLAKTADHKYVTGNLLADLTSRHTENQVLASLEKYLKELHLRYPCSSIYYSELGDADIIGRFHLVATAPGKIIHPDGSTLNPYLTVAGLVFMAFAPEEKTNGIFMKTPFEYTGLNAWGSMENFQKSVETARKNGYSQAPQLTPPTDLKIGIPVWRSPDHLGGAISFHLRNTEPKKNFDHIVKDIFAAAENFQVALKN